MVFQLPLSRLSVVFLGAGGLLLIIAALTYQIGGQTSVRDWFLALLGADAAWALTSPLPLEAGSDAVALAGETLRLTASSVAAVCWLCFALVYTGRGQSLTRRRVGMLAVPFVVHLLAFATNSFHGLSVQGLSVSVQAIPTVVTYDFGPVFLLVTVYSLALTMAGTGIIILTALTDPDLYADQSIALVAGSVMPIAGVALTAAGVGSVGSTNLTPALLSITAAGYGYALFRGDLLTASPVIAVRGRNVAVDSLGEGFLIVDGTGTVVEANAAAQTLLDVTEPAGESVETVFSGEFEPDTDRQVFRTDEGTILEARVTSLEEDDRLGGVGRVLTLRDVTKQRRQQERLQVLNRVMRHNLRNKLSVVQAYAGRLVDEPSESVDVEAAGQSMLDSTDDLLATVEKARTVEKRLDADESTHPVALSALLADRAATVADAADRPVEIETELEECTIRSNEAVLDMVVEELLDNALKHTDNPEPKIELTLTVDDGVTVRIADNGPGIPADDRKAVLSGQESALEHGSQIGLWTVRWGVRFLGGELSIESASTGSIVEFSLPGTTVRQPAE